MDMEVRQHHKCPQHYAWELIENETLKNACPHRIHWVHYEITLHNIWNHKIGKYQKSHE